MTPHKGGTLTHSLLPRCEQTLLEGGTAGEWVGGRHCGCCCRRRGGWRINCFRGKLKGYRPGANDIREIREDGVRVGEGAVNPVIAVGDQVWLILWRCLALKVTALLAEILGNSSKSHQYFLIRYHQDLCADYASKVSVVRRSPIPLMSFSNPY